VTKLKIIIGRVEKVNFSSLNIIDLDAKIDTGAYSSSIHCHDIFEDKENNLLCFKLLDPKHDDYRKKVLKFTEYSKVKVKSSNGISRWRFKIKTSIKIGKKTYITQFTLTDRSKMRYPVLIGRKVLNKRFLVDVSHKYLLKK